MGGDHGERFGFPKVLHIKPLGTPLPAVLICILIGNRDSKVFSSIQKEGMRNRAKYLSGDITVAILSQTLIGVTRLACQAVANNDLVHV